MTDEGPPAPPTLANCDREPIHVPGAIQSHGVLVACGAAFDVTQVSANVEAFFERPVASALGSDVTTWLSAESVGPLAQASAAGFPRDLNPMSIVSSAGRRYDAIVHHDDAGGPTILEFEPADHTFIGWDPRIRRSVRRFQQVGDIPALLDLAAREVRGLTGFDRVMVYRFDADWNGCVEAESRLDRLEAFKGLHYPAADIPAQARRLYTLNWLRIIPDVDYVPVPIEPTLDPATGRPLDLSLAVLRSVSPIHIQYLHNMGVTASMSVSLIHQDRLIGLIACHHYDGPHPVAYVTRETCEYLGQVVSWHLARLESHEAAGRAMATHRAQAEVVSAVATAATIPAGLMDPAILALTDATGAAVVYEGRVSEVGQTPGELHIRQIVHHLSGASSDGPFVTDRLSEVMPAAAAWDDTAAGVLAVDISREFGEFILWFRHATDRVVHWGGDPRVHDTAENASDTPRLSPRGSFALWREEVRGRSLPWESWQVDAADRLRTLLLGKFRERAVELRVMNARLEAADRAKDEFISTVSHELRTPLNGMLGWLRLLQTGALGVDERQRALSTIERNARAQAKLIEDLLDVSRIMSGKLTLNVETVLLGAVVDQAIETVRPAAAAKDIRIQTTMDSSAAVMGDTGRLVQVLTNLLSNAVKFSQREGRVQVLVERRESAVDISVADTGQGIAAEFLPLMFERFRQADVRTTRRTGGLGLGLAIARQIVELHGGSVTAMSDGPGCGATFTVKLPLSIAMRRDITAPAGSDRPQALECPPGLRGLKVLVVDDEPDARELLQTVFERCLSQVRSAASAAEALALMDSFKPDVLVSDVGMPDMDGYQLITAVRQRPPERGGRIPAVALTAYARIEDRTRALMSGFQVHVPKPVEPVEILAIVASLASVQPPR